jgi:hypothetical protein
MHKSSQKKVLKELKAFIEKHLGEEVTQDMQFLTGEEGMNYSEHASKEYPYVSFDGPLCEILYYGIDNWQFSTKLFDFLNERGMYYEFGHHWNMSIIEN